MKNGDLRVFLIFDYSQIEVRMLAELSEDELLISQFRSGLDIHCQVGHMLTGWPVEKIAKEKQVRKLVKNFHFGLIYGIGEEGMVEYLKAKGVLVTLAAVQKYMYKYFSTYKGVKRYIDRCRSKASTDHYVETLFGFRREIYEHQEGRDTYWGNQAVNTPVQGSAHQLMLIAMALLHLKPKTYCLLRHPLMEIHDALVFRVLLRELIGAYQEGKGLLEQGVVEYAKKKFGIQLQVPLIAEASAGFCLGSMVDYQGEGLEEFLAAWRKKHQEVESGWDKLFPSREVSV